MGKISGAAAFDRSKFQNDEATTAQALDKISSQDNVKNDPVKISGTYVMDVSTFCFRKKGTSDPIISPTIAPSSKGGLNLVTGLKVVDGTDCVRVGDYVTVNVPVWPKPGATQEEVENLFRLAKPRMCALLGVDNCKLDLDTIIDKFTTDWEDDGKGKYTLVKDHALKGRVVCVFEDDQYGTREVLKLTSMRRFKEGDKSVSNKAAVHATTQSNTVPEEQVAMHIPELQGQDVGPVSTELAPSVTQTDTMPF